MANHLSDPFESGLQYGSLANTIGRLEIYLPPLILMLDNNLEIHERLLAPVFEDSSIFYNKEDKMDISFIKDENLRARAEKILPSLERLSLLVL